MTGGQSFWLGLTLGIVLAVFLTSLAVRKVVSALVIENRELRIRNARLNFRIERHDRRRAVIPVDTIAEQPGEAR